MVGKRFPNIVIDCRLLVMFDCIVAQIVFIIIFDGFGEHDLRQVSVEENRETENVE